MNDLTDKGLRERAHTILQQANCQAVGDLGHSTEWHRDEAIFEALRAVRDEAQKAYEWGNHECEDGTIKPSARIFCNRRKCSEGLTRRTSSDAPCCKQARAEALEEAAKVVMAGMYDEMQEGLKSLLTVRAARIRALKDK